MLKLTLKRTLSWVLAVAMVVTLLPTITLPARAATIQPRTTALDLTQPTVSYKNSSGTDVSSVSTASNITDTGEGWAWYPNGDDTVADGTAALGISVLVLDSINLVTTDPIALKLPENSGTYKLTYIVLADDSENVIKSTYAVSESAGTTSAGLHVSGEVAFIGKGASLEVTGGNTSGSTIAVGSYGICNATGTLDFMDTSSFIATGGASRSYSAGIYTASTANVTGYYIGAKLGAKVSAVGGTSDLGSYGIFIGVSGSATGSNDLMLSDATVAALGGYSPSSYGVYTPRGTRVMSNSTLQAKGKSGALNTNITTASYDYAIGAYSDTLTTTTAKGTFTYSTAAHALVKTGTGGPAVTMPADPAPIPIIKRTTTLNLTATTLTYKGLSGSDLTANPTTTNISAPAEGWEWYRLASGSYAPNTLVLNGADIDVASGNALVVPSGITIILAENSINKVNAASGAGIVGTNALTTIKGPGRLELTSSGTCVSIASSYILIEGGTVNLTSTASYAIYANGFGMSSGTLTVTASDKVSFGDFNVPKGWPKALKYYTNTSESATGASGPFTGTGTDTSQIGSTIKYLKIESGEEDVAPVKRTSSANFGDTPSYMSIYGISFVGQAQTQNVDGSAEGWKWYRYAADGYNDYTLVLNGIDVDRTGATTGNTIGLPANSTVVTVAGSVNKINGGQNGISTTSNLTIKNSGDLTISGVSSTGISAYTFGSFQVIDGTVIISATGQAFYSTVTLPPDIYDVYASPNTDGTNPTGPDVTTIATTQKYVKITLHTTPSEPLTVSLRAGDGKVTLGALEAPESGCKYYYKSSAASVNRPALDSTFNSTGWTAWTAYDTDWNIAATNGTPVYVQVVMVDTNDGNKVKAWGQASATPGVPNNDAPIVQTLPMWSDTGIVAVMTMITLPAGATTADLTNKTITYTDETPSAVGTPVELSGNGRRGFYRIDTFTGAAKANKSYTVSYTHGGETYTASGTTPALKSSGVYNTLTGAFPATASGAASGSGPLWVYNGDNNVRTAYANRDGWFLHTYGDSGLQKWVTTKQFPDSGLTEVSFIFYNPTNAAINNVAIAMDADVQIGSDDCAPIFPVIKDGLYYGFTMEGRYSDVTLALVNPNAGKYGEEKALNWWGSYYSRTTQLSTDAEVTTPLTGTDSGAVAKVRDISVAPGSLQMYSFFIGTEGMDEIYPDVETVIEQSGACNVTSVESTGITSATIDQANKTINIKVPTGTANIEIDVNVSNGAEWKLYREALCNTEIGNKTLALPTGSPAYLEVTADDGTTKVYTVTVTAETPPPAPTVTGVSATAKEADANSGGWKSTVTVSGTDLAAGMLVKAFLPSGAMTGIAAITTGSGTSQTATLVFPENSSTTEAKNYTVKVSLDGGRTWVNSPTGTVTIAAATAPAAPANATASSVKKDRFTAKWDHVAGVNNYVIEVATDINFTSGSITHNEYIRCTCAPPATQCTFVVTGLTPDRQYYFRVSAAKGELVGAKSAPVTVEFVPTPGGTLTLPLTSPGSEDDLKRVFGNDWEEFIHKPSLPNTIKFIDEVILENPIEFDGTGEDITIDLNGFDITGPSGTDSDPDGEPAIIWNSTGDITIEGPGRIIGGDGDDNDSGNGGDGGDAVQSGNGGGDITIANDAEIIGGDGGNGGGNGNGGNGGNGVSSDDGNIIIDGGIINGGDGGDGGETGGNGGNGGNGVSFDEGNIDIDGGDINGGNGGGSPNGDGGNGGNGVSSDEGNIDIDGGEIIGGSGGDGGGTGNGGDGGNGTSNGTGATDISGGTIEGGDGGGSEDRTGGNGGDGVHSEGGDGDGDITITVGEITGGDGGGSDDGTGGNGGDGVSSESGDITIDDDPNIIGGEGGDSTNGDGGNGGNGVSSDEGKIDIDGGEIIGGNGGDGGETGGDGGNGTANGSGETDISGGTIEGGDGGDGDTKGGNGGDGVHSEGGDTDGDGDITITGGDINGGEGGGSDDGTGGDGGNGVSSDSGDITIEPSTPPGSDPTINGGEGGDGGTTGGDGGNGTSNGTGATDISGGTIEGGDGGEGDTKGGNGGNGAHSEGGGTDGDITISGGEINGGEGGGSEEGTGGNGGNGVSSDSGVIAIEPNPTPSGDYPVINGGDGGVGGTTGGDGGNGVNGDISGDNNGDIGGGDGGSGGTTGGNGGNGVNGDISGNNNGDIGGGDGGSGGTTGGNGGDGVSGDIGGDNNGNINGGDGGNGSGNETHGDGGIGVGGEIAGNEGIIVNGEDGGSFESAPGGTLTLPLLSGGGQPKTALDAVFGVDNYEYVAPNTIKLKENIQLEDTIIISGGDAAGDTDLIIDLNGHVMNGPDGEPTIKVQNGIDMKIKGTGKVIGGRGDRTINGGRGGDAIEVTSGGKLVIENADIIGGDGGDGGSPDGAGGDGGNGVESDGDVELDGGSIEGGDGGDGDGTGGGGNGGNGIKTENDGDINVIGGDIKGGDGGDSEDGTGGNGGNGTSTGSGDTENDGTISGGDGGTGGTTGGDGGNGSESDSGSVTVGNGGSSDGGDGGGSDSGSGGTGGNGIDTNSGNIVVDSGGSANGGDGGDTKTGTVGNGGKGTNSDSGSITGTGTVTNGGNGTVINSGNGSGSSTPAPPAPPTSNIIVDGKPVDAGKVEVKDDTTTVTVNQETIKEQLETATNNVTIVVPSETGTAVAQLVVQNVDDMAAKDMTLTVQVGNVQYELPTVAVDTSFILAALGASNAADVPISITVITDMSAAAQEAANEAVVSSGGELVIPPIEFKITASYGGQSVEISTFSQYVARRVEITAEQAAKITTALVVEQDGTTRHVPTYVYQNGGKWYATINSLTNSTYALIYNEKIFADAAGKWYESAVNEMGSRMVINGVGNDQFAGERDITRAEFAAIIVRALGLPATGNGAVFTDVSSSAWYNGAVGTAYKYGLVSGVGNNLFAPDKKISRQEAMLMIQRAAKLAGFTGSNGSVSTFTDNGNVSTWALDAAKWSVGSGLIVGSNGKLNPLSNITRAETATLVLKFVQKAGLVDVRTKF